VSLHLLPFLFVLYVIAYLDRVNFAYAALQMNRELDVFTEMFGYFIFKVPSNLILQRGGAHYHAGRSCPVRDPRGSCAGSSSQ